MEAAPNADLVIELPAYTAPISSTEENQEIDPPSYESHGFRFSRALYEEKLDLDGIAATMNTKVNQASRDCNQWDKLCIYKIPEFLRGVDDRACVPRVVSLGPYHRSDERLKPMESHKWRALYTWLERNGKKIEDCLDAVKGLEEQARACYEGPIELTSKEFVEMMIIDGCFILEFFLGADIGFQGLGYSESDPVFSVCGTMRLIQRDMIMLENQIPMFILDRLHGIPKSSEFGVSGLALRFFYSLIPRAGPRAKSHPLQLWSSLNMKDFYRSIIPDHLHCLDLLHWMLLSIRFFEEPDGRLAPIVETPYRYKYKRLGEGSDTRRQLLMHPVTYLKDRGVKFKKRSADILWDMKFDKGSFEIPCLSMDVDTKSLLLNFLAFEQRHWQQTGREITAYMMFIDYLIDTPSDVSHLRQRGIVTNDLEADEEVADFFNRACRAVVVDHHDSSLADIASQVNEFCNRPFNSWKGTLRDKYFGNPWSIISLIAALVLLILAFLQTLYSMYAYYRPPS